MFKLITLLTLCVLGIAYQSQGNILKLNAQDFNNAKSEFQFLFVNFIREECAHCQRMATEYSTAADTAATENFSVKFAEFDCTDAEQICSQFEIQGFPTVLLLNRGQDPSKFNRPRKAPEVINWLKEMIPAEKLIKKAAEESNSPVLVEDESKGYEKDQSLYILTAQTYQNALKEFDYVLVKFFAPWCGHCKKLAPAYIAAANKISSKHTKSILAEVDCTVHKPVCSANKIRGYPTLKMFVRGQNAPIDFAASRTEQGIVEWVESTMANNIAIEEQKVQEEEPKLNEL